MALKFYFNPHSRAATTRVLLEELGIPYDIVAMNYDDGSMRTPEFLAVNPMGKIPVIEDDGVVVTESIAIGLYLADKYKSPHDLAPAIDDPRRGDYLRWMAFVPGALEPAMVQKTVGFDIKRQQAGWGSTDLVWDVVKQRVSRAEPYLLGDQFTAADVYFGGTVSWMVHFNLFPADDAVTRYVARLKDRPAWAALP